MKKHIELEFDTDLTWHLIDNLCDAQFKKYKSLEYKFEQDKCVQFSYSTEFFVNTEVRKFYEKI